MIVKMKKLTLLVSESQREKCLKQLRNLGVMHIENVTKPFADEISSIEDSIAQSKKAIDVLNQYYNKDVSHKTVWRFSDVPGHVGDLLSISSEREEHLKNISDIEIQMQWYKIWGSFKPSDILELRKKGVFLQLYRADKKAFKKSGQRKDVQVINRDKQYVYCVHLSPTGDEDLLFERVKLPETSYADLFKKHEILHKRVEEIESVLRTKALAKESLGTYIADVEKKNVFLHVMHGMKQEKGFSYVQGYCPIPKVKDVTELARAQGVGYLAEDPDNPEEVPTLIKNPKWIDIIRPVFKFMNTIPGYQEYDISLWFLMFFSLFFAMLIGDAGYGILFLIVTLFARLKFKKAPREPFFLMYALSIVTIVWGAVTGTWFGAERIAQLPILNSLVINDVNSFVDGNQNFMIYICFIIGVVQLSIAHFIIAFRLMNSLKALAEIGWISVLWGLFFTAGTLVIGRPFPQIAPYLIAGGSGLIILFSNPQKNILKGIFSSLAELPLKIVSSFSDVVSYLRLFAVGYASVVVASSFNNMALELGFGNIITSLGAALIMVFGHLLNIVLGFMAVIVHGVRLNMLEFSGQMGMEWSGKDYSPFSEEKTTKE